MRDVLVETKLGQYIQINTGKLDVNAASEFGEYPFFTCSRETYRIDQAAFEGESVLVAGNGDLNVKYYDGKFNAYQRTYVLNSVDREILDNRFLFLYLQTYIEYLRSETRGTVIQYLKKGQFTDAKIKLPPLPEQKRIVDLISSVDSYIEALQKQLESAKKSRNAVLHELLTVSGDDWEKTTLGDIANWSGGITPSMANLEFWEGGDIPWISSGDIATYESEGTKKNVTQKALSDTSLKLLPSGTVIVVVRSGILLHSLPVAILRAPATINQDIKAAQPKNGIKPEFLWFLLRYLEKEILSTCRKTGTTVQSIGTEALLGTKIKLPPMSVQESICEVVSAMDLVTNQSEKLIIEAKNLRSGLLSDLLSGVHEIPASYDKVLGAE
jgi:type I restriction enzyme S subunit